MLGRRKHAHEVRQGQKWFLQQTIFSRALRTRTMGNQSEKGSKSICSREFASEKPTENMRKLTNVTFDQAKSVRSKKQQTTPRLSSAVTQSKPVGAVQIAPPVRAGPSSKVYRPPPVLTSSSASELATSTPRSVTQSKSLSEALEISKIPVDHEIAPVSREPSIKEPLDKPLEVVGDAFDRQKLTGKNLNFSRYLTRKLRVVTPLFRTSTHYKINV